MTIISKAESYQMNYISDLFIVMTACVEPAYFLDEPVTKE